MIRTDKRLRLCVCLLVCVLTFIWGNSLLPADISRAFSDWVKKMLLNIMPSESPQTAQGSGFLRKIAHFMEFSALGLLLCWLFGMLKKRIYLPVLLGVAAACIDETIQFFVPGRGPELRDVWIDSCGVLAGVILLAVGHHYFKKKTT